MSSNPSEEVVIGGNRAVNVRLVIGLLIVIALLAFVFQNTNDTTFTFLWLNVTMPMWGLALTIFGGGLITGWLMHVRRAKRRAAH